MAKSNDRDKTETPEVGYRAYLIKDNGKFIVTFPAMEYDPNAERLTELQVRGIAEVSAQFERAAGIQASTAVAIRFDPLRAALNTGGPPHGPGPSPSGGTVTPPGTSGPKSG